MESPINSAEDLVGQKEISYGCIGTGSTKDFFAVNMSFVIYAFLSKFAAGYYMCP